MLEEIESPPVKSLTKEEKRQLAEEIVNCPERDIRQHAEEAAQKANLHFSDLWNYVLLVKKEQVLQQIPDDFDLNLLAQKEYRQEFIKKINLGGLDLVNRFEELCSNPVSFKSLRAVLLDDDMPQEDQWLFSSLICNESITEEILSELIDKGRYLCAIAHLRGPRRILEKVLEHEEHSEAVITLFQSYYCEEGVSLSEFESYLEKYRHIISPKYLGKYLSAFCHGEKKLLLEGKY